MKKFFIGLYYFMSIGFVGSTSSGALLHQTFKDKQVNKVNPRKEFFKVSLTDIAELVKKEFNATTEFTMLAEAAQYRESLRIAETSNATA